MNRRPAGEEYRLSAGRLGTAPSLRFGGPLADSYLSSAITPLTPVLSKSLPMSKQALQTIGHVTAVVTFVSVALAPAPIVDHTNGL